MAKVSLSTSPLRILRRRAQDSTCRWLSVLWAPTAVSRRRRSPTASLWESCRSPVAFAAFVARCRSPLRLAAGKFPASSSPKPTPVKPPWLASRRLPGAFVAGCIHFVNSGKRIAPLKADGDALLRESQEFLVDFKDVRGQQTAKRAIEISCAGKERRAQTLDEENVLRQERSQQSLRRCAQIGSSISIVAATRRDYAVRREPMRLRQKRDLLARRPTRIDLWDARAHTVYRSCRQIERTSIRAGWTTSVRTSSQ